MDDVATVAGWVADARRVAVLTGAGVSTGSGIPDYRGPQGVWTKDPAAERRATIDVWINDPEVRRRQWAERAAGSHLLDAAPNPAHRAFADLERLDRLDTLVTQNTDGLHLRAGSSPDRVVEIHGNVRDTVCLACEARQPTTAVLDRVRAGEADPVCEACGGVLKWATVSFGQALDPADLERAHAAAAACDVFLAAGTSLAVYPVAALPEVALGSGARVVIANAEPTPYDRAADAVLRGDLTELLPAVVDIVRDRLAGPPADVENP
jgi:NAD-dependent deacetylase